MPKVSAQKSSGNIAPVLLLLMALVIVGTVGGYYYGLKANPNVKGKKVGIVNITTPFTPSSAAEKMIAQPVKDWGSLVQQTYGEFQVKGQVADISTGTSQMGDTSGFGTFFTLKNGNVQQKFFVQGDALFREGKENDFNTWKKIKVSDIKVGDTIAIQMHAQFKEGVTPADYFGFSVFKFD